MEIPFANVLDKRAKRDLSAISKRSYFAEFIELSVERWLTQKYFKRQIEIAGIAALPRDYHWYSHFARIDGEIVMVHAIYDHYGSFDAADLEVALSHRKTNAVYSSKLIICLISSNKKAFKYAPEMLAAMQCVKGVEYVRLLHERSYIHEIAANDEIIEEYCEGQPLFFGRTLSQS